MNTEPKSPPNSVHKIVQFDHPNKKAVLAWLVENMMDDCVLSPNNMGAVDSQGYWRWRMSLSAKGRSVLFERAEDVAVFCTVWP